MQKQSITFQKYTIDDKDKIAVYSKLRARHAATGLDYFAKLRTSTTLAIYGIADGIGEDLLHAATVGRLETEAYERDVVHNMPLSLAAFEVLLKDVGHLSGEVMTVVQTHIVVNEVDLPNARHVRGDDLRIIRDDRAVVVVVAQLFVEVVAHAGIEDAFYALVDEPLHMAVGQFGGITLGF